MSILPTNDFLVCGFQFFGGTNFEQTLGRPNQITCYDYDAPIDEYGGLCSVDVLRFSFCKRSYLVREICSCIFGDA